MNEELVKKVLGCAKKNADTVSNLVGAMEALVEVVREVERRVVKLEVKQKEKLNGKNEVK